MLWRATTEGAPFLSGRSMVMAGHEDQKFVCYPISRAAEREGRSLINWIAELRIHDQKTWRREDWNRTVDTSEFLSNSKIGISVGSRCRILFAGRRPFMNFRWLIVIRWNVGVSDV